MWHTHISARRARSGVEDDDLRGKRLGVSLTWLGYYHPGWAVACPL